MRKKNANSPELLSLRYFNNEKLTGIRSQIASDENRVFVCFSKLGTRPTYFQKAYFEERLSVENQLFIEFTQQPVAIECENL